MNAMVITSQEIKIPFAGLHNRMRMHRHCEDLERITEAAGARLRTAIREGDPETSSELQSVIGSAVYIKTMLDCLMESASKEEMEGPEVVDIIARAQTMVDIMNSATFH